MMNLRTDFGEGKSVPANIQVIVESLDNSRDVVGEILPFNNQPIGKKGGDLYGIAVRFEWNFGRVTRVIVNTRADAIKLLATLAPKRILPPVRAES